MATFQTKDDLPKATQIELARIEAISSGLRNSTEADFLTALTPYRYNRIVRWDTDEISTPTQPKAHLSTDPILEAEGNTLPSGYEGFKKGAIFYDLDQTGRNVFVNTGDEDSAIWQLVGEEWAVSESTSLSPSGSASPSGS